MKQRPTSFFSRLIYNLVKRYRHSTIPRWVFLVMDMALFVVSFVLMKAASMYGLSMESLQGGIFEFAVSGVMTLMFFLGVGTHRGIVRHLGMSDVYKILIATMGPMLLLWTFKFLNNTIRPQIISSQYLLSYSDAFYLFFTLAVMMIIARLAIQKIYNDYFKKRRPEVNIVIYGAGAAGIITINALKQDIHYDYKVVAFVDDDLSKVNQELNGVPVMRARAVLNQKFVDKNNVKELIIA
nr:hypothetical protein [Bacteroidales bacterium]